MKRSLEVLQELSYKCESHTTIYKFNKDIDASEKYRKGRISASTWLNDLIYYYICKERDFLKEFKEHIQEQRLSISELKDSEYKIGLFDQLNSIEDELDKAIKRN